MRNAENRVLLKTYTGTFEGGRTNESFKCPRTKHENEKEQKNDRKPFTNAETQVALFNGFTRTGVLHYF
jgi:hypothetical protein